MVKSTTETKRAVGSKVHTLRFRAADQEIFSAIKNGKKKVETRASSTRYESITKGDILRFVCGKLEFQKRTSAVKKFGSVKAMLREYKPMEINPNIKTASELKKMYNSFSGYREKIKRYGLLALELK
ncbi:hypothetical protein CMO96_03970 [Candidatus Woesebacteria bacterium]|nr:hypothetical protein [Candidatus Woesebacteria bacterium]|tara:strand:- start:1019 stop:1399 length:381 start_codon:yes stop_codon:yes gene_type:complete